AADGTEVRAWLRLPEGEGPHPLVVFAHGGPWGSWNAWTYRWNPGPFVAAGYAVLLPDPAISTGYGQSMIDRGQHELGGAPFTDIMALTDAVVARDDIDAERTAFAGGSYGGYMANWVAGHTGDRFRCIVTHASLWDTPPWARPLTTRPGSGRCASRTGATTPRTSSPTSRCRCWSYTATRTTGYRSPRDMPSGTTCTSSRRPRVTPRDAHVTAYCTTSE